MNKVLLALLSVVLSSSLLAQESPTTAKAARVQIIQGPEIALAKLAAIFAIFTSLASRTS
jgi:hypothetical protein